MLNSGGMNRTKRWRHPMPYLMWLYFNTPSVLNFMTIRTNALRRPSLRLDKCEQAYWASLLPLLLYGPSSRSFLLLFCFLFSFISRFENLGNRNIIETTSLAVNGKKDHLYIYIYIRRYTWAICGPRTPPPSSSIYRL